MIIWHLYETVCGTPAHTECNGTKEKTKKRRMPAAEIPPAKHAENPHPTVAGNPQKPNAEIPQQTKTKFKKERTTATVVSVEDVKTELEVCGVNSSGFSPDFFECLAKRFTENAMDRERQERCIRWMWDYVKQNCKTGRVQGYFYKMVMKAVLVDKFLEEETALLKAEEERRKAERNRYSNCVVCGYDQVVHGTSCPKCGFDSTKADDAGAVQLHKGLVALSPERRAEYDKEVEEITLKMLKMKFNEREGFGEREMRELNRRYGLIE